MVNWQGRSKRKSTGGRYKSYRRKRKFELGSPPIETLIGPKKVKKVRTRGGNLKRKLLQAEIVNVTNFDGTTNSTKIISVVRNPANKEYDRRKIITKGTILETELGMARVTSRPGQIGTLNAILIKEE